MMASLLVVFATLLSYVSSQQATAAFPDCVNGYLAKYPICNSSLPAEERAVNLVSLMNLTEKAIRLQNDAPGIDRIGLPYYEWWSEALHGIAYSPGVHFDKSGTYRCATSFPEPIGLGATFDRDLVRQAAGITSDEGRAFNNMGKAGMDFWTPNINIFRDPRWGRGQETPGEDTYLSSEYVYYLIDGYQNGEDPRYYKVVADCKHYAGYDVEHWHGIDRYSYNAVISNQDLVETYLPSFKSCLKDAKVGSIMCSYNAVNGVPACANDLLMNQIARGKWGWNGWVTSDCGAVSGIYDGHHYVANHSAQVKVALEAGCDIGCDQALADYAVAAVKDGSVSEATIDRALVRTFTSLVKLGYFDSPDDQPYRKYGPERISTRRAVDLSHRAARESLVLLKNDGVLPINPTSIKNVAVIGPNARNQGTQIGNYNGAACFMHTVFDGFTTLGYNTVYQWGCDINTTNTNGFKDAMAAAQQADLIIFAGGINETVESEGHDRDFIDLPGVQSELISQLGQLNKPLVLVLFGGGGVDVSAEASSSNVNAIVWAGYPSQSGGDAIAELIMGRFSPAGRLPVTWYPADYVNQVPLTDQSMRQDTQSGNPGRTYKFYTGTPVFPFGQGLSYSEFTYQTVQSPAKEIRIADLAAMHAGRFDERDVQAASWTVTVTNTGKVPSDIVVLAFVSSNATFAGVTPPIKELFDYTRIHDMQPGASQTVIFGLSYRVWSSIDQDGHSWLLPGTYRIAINNEESLAEEFRLTGEPLLLESSPLPTAAKPNLKKYKVASE